MKKEDNWGLKILGFMVFVGRKGLGFVDTTPL
jgi:hypothetical protein